MFQQTSYRTADQSLPAPGLQESVGATCRVAGAARLLPRLWGCWDRGLSVPGCCPGSEPSAGQPAPLAGWSRSSAVSD